MSISRDFAAAQILRFSYLLQVGLNLGAITLAKRLRLETLFVVTELRLASPLRAAQREDPASLRPVEHRGERIPSPMAVSSLEGHLPRPVRPSYEMISGAIRAGLEAQERGLLHGMRRGSARGRACRPVGRAYR